MGEDFEGREGAHAMYEIAICDDDGAFVSDFQALLAEVMTDRCADYRLTRFSDPAELLHAINGGDSFGLVFMDILFGVEKGVRCARMLRARDREFELVFVTTNPEYAVECFSAFPLSFLLKPVVRGKLADVIDRFLEKRQPRVLCLSTTRGTLRMPVTDVLYFEIYGHTIVIHLSDGSSKSWTGSLKELEDSLPQNFFVRSHRSYLVNLEHVAEFERCWIRLSSGDTVPVSKSAHSKVQSSLIEFEDRKLLTR